MNRQRYTRNSDAKVLGLLASAVVIYLLFLVAIVAVVTAAVIFTAKAVGATPGHVEVSICHKPGTPAEHTIVVDEDAVPAHLDHGDYLGECQVVIPDDPPVDPEDPPVTPDVPSTPVSPDVPVEIDTAISVTALPAPAVPVDATPVTTG